MTVDGQGAGFAIDASALIAVLKREAGWRAVPGKLPNSIMSTVNWTEVAQKCHELGSDPAQLKSEALKGGMRLIPFEAVHADLAATIWRDNPRSGLSLGDRACLALAYARGLPVLTGDRDWLRADTGVNIELFRP